MNVNLQDAVHAAQTGNVPPMGAARPVSPDQVDAFFHAQPQPQPQPARQQPHQQAARSPRRPFKFGLNLGFAPKQADSRLMKIIGALFLFAFAGAIWLLSESTTLSIPRLFTKALDVAPTSYAAWVGLLAMSFLIVAHKPRFGMLTIKDLWWCAFTLIDTGTTFVAIMDIATSKAAISHIALAQGSIYWFVMVVGSLLLAIICVFAPITTMREAIRLIRWEM